MLYQQTWKRSLFVILLTFSLSALLAQMAGSAPLRNMPITVTQPDGTVLNLLATGDEYFHWVHDSAGFPIVQDTGSGWYVYADQSTGELLPSKYVVGQTDPASVGLQNYLTIPVKSIRAAKAQSRANLLPARTKQSVAATTGQLNNIAIFIMFADETSQVFSDPLSKINALFNTTTTIGDTTDLCLENYYNWVSYGKLDLQTHFFPTTTNGTILAYQDAHPRAYYQPLSKTNPLGYSTTDNNVQYEAREHALLQAAIASVKSQIESSGLNVDTNADHTVDDITFIISGAVDGWSDMLWPHMWNMPAGASYISGNAVDGYTFVLYNDEIQYPSTICHETFHVLGAPDLYEYGDQSAEPVGLWDLMADGSYGYPNTSMGMYMKWRYGKWIDSIPEITTSGSYTLHSVGSPTNNCYKISTPFSSTDFLVLEYRTCASGSFDSDIPTPGLLIYKINTNYDGLGNADGPPDEVYIYRPGASLILTDGNIDNAAYSSDLRRTLFNSTTDPFPFLSNGLQAGIGISNVGAILNTISFDVTMPSKAAMPVITPPGGTFTSPQTVSISCSTPGATIYYTTDGTTPSIVSPIYSRPFVLSTNKTVMAFATAPGYINSETAMDSFAFLTKVATPAISPAGGSFITPQTVSLTCTTPGAAIYYTTNGSIPTQNSTPYIRPFTLSASTTVKAFATHLGDVDSDASQATFTFLKKVMAPVISPSSGTYSSATTVSMTCATAGATIYYTTDGSIPTSTSNLYTQPFSLSAYTKLKAVALENGYVPSDITTDTLYFKPKGIIAGLSNGGAVWYSTDMHTWKGIPGCLSQIVMGDFNGDLSYDLAGLAQDGSIWYTTDRASWIKIPGYLKSLVVGRFDNSGLDQLAGLSTDGSVWYTTDLHSWTKVPGVLLSQLAAGDLAGNGVDGLAGLAEDGSIWYSKNLTTMTKIPGFLSKIAVGDFDGDGNDDIAGISTDGGIWYTTDETNWIHPSGHLTSIVAADLNGDGMDDIAGLSSDGSVWYTINKSGWNRITTSLMNLSAGKINDDAKSDLAGLSAIGSIWFTSDAKNWTNVPGNLSCVCIARR